MGFTSFLGFSYPKPASCFSENLVEKIKTFVQDFVPIRTALRGGG